MDPELAERLQRGLSAQGFAPAADSVFDLRLGEPCRCGDVRCASFYAAGGVKLPWVWRRRPRAVMLQADPLLRVELLGGRIVAVEVVDRPLLRGTLHASAA